MSGLAKLDERIAAMEAAAVELRQVTADAHAATKDLRKAQREVRDLLSTEVRALVDEAVAEQVKAGLDDYRGTLESALAKADEGVKRRFDELTRLYLDGGPGDTPLHDLAVAARDKRRSHR